MGLLAWNKITNFDRNLAVVIGIDNYKNHDNPHNLSTPVSDANALADLLEKEFGYQHENVYRLIDEQANLDGLKTLLDDTLPNLLKPTDSDRLIFYFAGHGLPKNSDEGPTGYLVPQDADISKADSLLSMSKVYDALNQLQCHHLLVVLDCCFAGTFRWASRKAIVKLEAIHREHYDRFIRFPTWQLITSSAHDQEALDVVILSKDRRGKVDDQNHSPFALALLEALQDGDIESDGKRYQKADYTRDRLVRAHGLILYLSDRLSQLSKDRQVPGLYPLNREYDKGEFIFVKPGFDPKQLSPAPELNEESNPYRGLKPFEERHAQFFFGRQKLVEKLSDRFAKSHHPLTVVLGISGSGKSSLVKAGLLPHLRQKQQTEALAQRWYILDPMRPGKSPFAELAKTLLPIANSNLIADLSQLNFLDQTFEKILPSKSGHQQKAISHNSTSPDSQDELSGEQALLATKNLAEWWYTATKEQNNAAKLRLVVNYFNKLKDFCDQEQQNKLSDFHCKINNTLDPLTQSLQQNPDNFTDLMTKWSQSNPNTKLLLVIDQFEELVTMNQDNLGRNEQRNLQEQDREKEWQKFLHLLRNTLAKYRRQLHVILTLRSDFEPRFLNSYLKNHWKYARFQVQGINSEGGMNSDELREVIEGPALKQALYFEPPELVGKLIDDVGQMPGALPLLSFTLSELYIKLYKRWINDQSTDRALRIKDYEELGGVTNALTRRATEEYENLIKEFGEESGKAYQATIRRVMLRMVTIEVGGIARRRVLMDELEYPSSEENDRVARVIERLVKARLLVKGQETEKPYVEPSHDFLVREWNNLNKWIEEQKGSLVLQQRLTPAVNDWNKNGQPSTDYLWDNDPRLPQLEKVVDSDDNWFNQIETEFVKRSIRQREEEDINQKKQTINLFSRASQAFFASNQHLEALIEAVKGGKELQKLRDKLQQLQEKAILEENEAAIRKEIDIVKNQVVIALEQAVYEVRERNRLEGHTGPVESVCFSPDGQMIASAAWDNTVKLWSRDGREINTLHQDFNTPEGYSTMVLSVSFSPNSETIAACGDNTVKLWHRGNGQYITTLTGHTGDINCVCFSPDGQTIASASRDNTIKLWTLNGEERITLLGHTGDVTSVSFSPDGQTIASGSYDNTVKLWNLDGTTKTTLTHDSTIYDVSFSRVGKKLVTASSDNTVKLWNLNLSNIEKQKPITFKGHTGEVNSVSFSPDGKTIASASSDNTVKLWNLDGQEIITLTGHSGKVLSVSFSPDGKTIASSSYDSTVKLWNSYRQKRPTLAQRISDGGHTEITKLSFSPDGNIIAGAGASGLEIWNLTSQEIRNIESRVASVSFSPDGQAIAFGCFENQVKVYQLDDQSLRTFNSLNGHSSAVRSVSFSPNGQMIASGSNDKTVKLWSRDGQMLRTLSGHTGGVWSVTFSPDSQIIASGSDGSDKTVKIWSRDGQEIKTLRGHQNTVNSICFSPDGQIIASASSDNTVKLWSPDGQEIKTLRGHDYQVFWVSFSPDGQMIASADWDGTAKLWSGNGQLLKTLKKRRNKFSWFYSICFSPDGQMIASGTSDGVLLWNFNLDDLVERGCNWVHDYLKNNPNVEESDRKVLSPIVQILLN